MEPRAILEAKPLEGYRLWLRFDNGIEATADISELVMSTGGVFVALRDPAEFAKVFVDQESRTVAWPNRVDLCPDSLYESICQRPASSEPRIQTVRVTRDEIIANLVDGRVISVPLAWSWRLSDATPAQRANYRLIGSGQGVHWPDVDEDISVEGLLHGCPAARPEGIRRETKRA